MFDDQQSKSKATEKVVEKFSDPESSSEVDEVGDSYKIVNVLSVSFVILGIICFIAGCFIAVAQDNSFSWISILSGSFVMMANFSFAVVMRVCALYMKEHDDIILKIKL